MEKTSFTCPTCSVDFTKATKEVTRQRKKNPERVFYCSLRCSGKISHEHLRGYRGTQFESGSEHHRNAVSAAVVKNTRYTATDKPFAEYLRRARQRWHQFDLDMDYLKELWQRQGGRCAISNIPIEHIGVGSNKVTQASLDRKDGNVGYIKGNVQFVSYCVNLAKNSLTDDSAHLLMRLICENYLTAGASSVK